MFMYFSRVAGNRACHQRGHELLNALLLPHRVHTGRPGQLVPLAVRLQAGCELSLALAPASV